MEPSQQAEVPQEQAPARAAWESAAGSRQSPHDGGGSSAHSQASTDDDTHTDASEAPEEVPLGWEKRGTALGLLIDSTVYIRPFVMMMVVLLGVWTEKRWQSPCPPQSGEFATLKACMCEYTKAYILCFPEVALSVLLLMVARNLLQKRFYYGLLKGGGCVEYTGGSPTADAVMVFLVGCFLHILVFMLLVLTSFVEPPELAAHSGRSGSARKTTWGMDHAKVVLVMKLTGFILIPGVVTLAAVWGAYDIELTLVPLSRFVRCAAEHEKATGGKPWCEHAQSGLGSMSILEDRYIKVLFETRTAEITNAFTEGGLSFMYNKAINLYKEKEDEYQKLNSNPPPLLDSLWPGTVLLHKHAKPAEGGNELMSLKDKHKMATAAFENLWRAFLLVSCIIFVLLLVFFGERMYFGLILRTLAGKMGTQDAPRLLVELIHIILVVITLWRMLAITIRRFAGGYDPYAGLQKGMAGLQSLKGQDGPKERVKRVPILPRARKHYSGPPFAVPFLPIQ